MYFELSFLVTVSVNKTVLDCNRVDSSLSHGIGFFGLIVTITTKFKYYN